jgi:hypothetical protein
LAKSCGAFISEAYQIIRHSGSETVDILRL